MKKAKFVFYFSPSWAWRFWFWAGAIFNTDSAMTVSEHPAAEVARNAAHGGHDDWFLPSREELNEMYGQRAAIGGFDTVFYWSSSQGATDSAVRQSFDNGDFDSDGKTDSDKVRVARRL